MCRRISTPFAQSLRAWTLVVSLGLAPAAATLGGELSAFGPPPAYYAPPRLQQGPDAWCPTGCAEAGPHGVYAEGGASVDDLQRRVSELEARLGCCDGASGMWSRPAGYGFPLVELHGRVYADSAWFHQDAANMAEVDDIDDGSGFRTLRFGAHGWLSPTMEYEIEFDFAEHGDAPDVKDAWLAFTDLPVLGNVKVGHFKEPFSLEEMQSSRFITFMERGLPNVFTPSRNMGVSAYNWSSDLSRTWAIGAFRTGSDNFGDDVGDEGEQAVTTRVTFLPYYDEASCGRSLIHVGGAYSFRDADEGTERFRERPEIKLSTEDEGSVPRFVNTGKIMTHDVQLYGAEAAFVRGPFSMQAEYIGATVDRKSGGDLYFYGAYAYASYFLTGEHRPYDRRAGEFSRVYPFEDFFRIRGRRGICGGSGAWELAARWSYLELNDDTVDGGRLTNYTVGVNWYMNPFSRIMFNYIHADLDDPGSGDSDANIFATRVQFDF